jgi:hypothetical protein
MGQAANKIFRLRLGIFLFILSWLPIAQIILAIAHDHGKWTSDHASQVCRLIVWTIQFIIGLIGVWLAGQVAIKAAKQDGWRHSPKKLWHLFWSGQAG